MVWMEKMLRTTGFYTEDKLEAADLIQSYSMDNIPRYTHLMNRLKKSKGQPVRPAGRAPGTRSYL